MATRTDDDVSDCGGRLGFTLITGGVAVVLIGAITAGCLAATDRFPGDSMDIAWKTPADDKASKQGNGAWLAGDTLVRSRSDAVTGYDAGTGKRTWGYRPPGRSEICAAEADLDSSVLLVTRDDETRPASSKRELCTTATAIDMKNGREIWRAPIPAVEGGNGFEPNPVAAGGGFAVLADKGLRAVDVRTGASRWTAAVPANCVPGKVAPAKRHVAALLACGDPEQRTSGGIPVGAELHAAAFDPATGALLWSTPFGDREPVNYSVATSVISADPLVVGYEGGAFHSFRHDGRPNPPIDYDGAYGTLDGKRPLESATDGTRLYALASYRRKGGTRHRAVAFDLATGQQVWKTGLDDTPGLGLNLHDGKVTVIVRTSPTSALANEDLYVLDAATGKERDVRSFHDSVATARIFEYKGLLIGASLSDYVPTDPPFTAYKRS
ncbi:Outer membrane protein assembly factor BamB [Streptomyces xanthophaeus]|uniref:outer membrane protein assembly factor BamB family protein n=1 Tax=Streptomyces xanthophaeus TaxID=67385 RepID=UPI00233E6FFF|nr:PQQ-binding-like beta-propeller repeat protein [Streptomyces xanthophaeus]WCD90917.1 Outer membrane protein assembly factor BamB [Streptomyces xanthophaeus]